MAEDKFNNFRNELTDILRESGIGEGLLADAGRTVNTMAELYKRMETKEMVADLHKLASADKVQAATWIPAAARIDFMVATRRDFQLRARNTVQAMRLRNDGGESNTSDKVSYGFATNALNEFADKMIFIEAKAKK